MPTVADRNCFHCHQPGRFRRSCPMIASKSADVTYPPLSTNACKTIEYTKTKEAYIELIIADRTCSCLLDTGSDVTLFPHVLVRGLPLDRCVVDLSAAYGTSIPTLGAVTVTAKLQGRDFEIEGLVTDHVDEVILGLDWLHAKGADWNFRTGKLTVDWQVYQLVDEMKSTHCWRLILQEPVTNPARRQLNVSTMVVYPTYSSTWVDVEKAWMREAGEIAGKGVQTSRTLVPSRSKDATANTVLAKLAKWFWRNKLSLNVNKTNYVLFCSHQKKLLTQMKLTIDNITIEQTDKTTFLGIILIKI